jgi:hypothetical protein
MRMSNKGLSEMGTMVTSLGEKALWSLLLSYYLLILIIISKTNINSIHYNNQNIPSLIRHHSSNNTFKYCHHIPSNIYIEKRNKIVEKLVSNAGDEGFKGWICYEMFVK